MYYFKLNIYLFLISNERGIIFNFILSNYLNFNKQYSIFTTSMSFKHINVKNII